MDDPTDDRPGVLLGCPSRSGHAPYGRHWLAGQAVHASPAGALAVHPVHATVSILPACFNLLWCEGLNARPDATYFAMIHDDVIPEAGWLDRLVDTLEFFGADIVSAVVPIKNNQGLTSTALDDPDPWRPRRLTMREVYDLPPVFGSEEAGGPILLNTGLWVCRLDRPWVEKVWFRQTDRVIFSEDGQALAQTIPEDWDFSRQVRAAGGVKLYATRDIALYHDRPEYTNTRPWGKWRRDEDWPGFAEPVARPAPETQFAGAN